MAEEGGLCGAPGSAVRPSRWRSDLWWVVAATVGCYMLASAFELQESISHRLARFESWQADEMPISLTVLACGLAWYALRRRREIQAQLQLRQQAELRIADLLAHKRELAQQLISLQESERLALARELHDELGQSCTAIRVETAYLSNLCRASVLTGSVPADSMALRGHELADRAAMLASAARADEAALGLYRLVRDMLSRLRPAHLDSLGLAAALQALCESWETRTAVICSLQIEGDVEALGDTMDITVYRVAQEALTNVARHAGARSVQVTLSRESPVAVSLSVRDDGRGMDTERATRGLGLIGAVERAAAVGGELEVSSAPGEGVAIWLRVPVVAARGSAVRSEPVEMAAARPCHAPFDSLRTIGDTSSARAALAQTESAQKEAA